MREVGRSRPLQRLNGLTKCGAIAPGYAQHSTEHISQAKFDTSGGRSIEGNAIRSPIRTGVKGYRWLEFNNAVIDQQLQDLIFGIVPQAIQTLVIGHESTSGPAQVDG